MQWRIDDALLACRECEGSLDRSRRRLQLLHKRTLGACLLFSLARLSISACLDLAGHCEAGQLIKEPSWHPLRAPSAGQVDLSILHKDPHLPPRAAERNVMLLLQPPAKGWARLSIRLPKLAAAQKSRNGGQV